MHCCRVLTFASARLSCHYKCESAHVMEFHHQIKENNKLLKCIHSSDKYKWFPKQEKLPPLQQACEKKLINFSLISLHQSPNAFGHFHITGFFI